MNSYALPASVRPQPARLDRLAAGRKLVDHAHIEVGEVRQRQRARDRRGRHHQVVRRMALALEHRALPHAELVLLVDDDQAEVGELDVFLNQRLRADGEVNFAVRESLWRSTRGCCASCGW